MTTLDNLRTNAKRFLKSLRLNDPVALERLRRAYPNAPAEPGLRDVQHALARERGHENWKTLKASLGQAEAPDGSFGAHSHEERVARFLEFACWDHHVHGLASHEVQARAAMRLLERHPEIARANLYTAVVCGEVETVERLLAERPEAAVESGGSRDWPPLLYLCYARIPHAATERHAVPIARALLDLGADPNAHYMAYDVPYTALVGAAGEGEQHSPRQPQGPALFQLLLDRGAETFDVQVLYNTHFTGHVLWWLEMVYAHTRATERASVWDDPTWSMLDMGPYGPGAYFLLRIAIDKNDLALARWVLDRGASPNAHHSAHPKFRPTRSQLDDARIQGLVEMADLLARYGGISMTPALEEEDAFVAACFRMDRDAVRAAIDRHPQYLTSPRAMFAAAKRNRDDVVAFLLDLGMSTEVEDAQKQRPLHVAAGNDAHRVAALLLARGADVDPREANYSATPLGYAEHDCRRAMLDLLSPVSRDVWILVATGNIDRLRAVLEAEPGLATVTTKHGATPLFWLPDDDAVAAEIVTLLVRHGADASVTTATGRTAAEAAVKLGLDEAARRLAEAAAARAPASPRAEESPA